MHPLKFKVLILTLFISACSNPGIVKLSPDTYMLAREAHGGIFQSAAKMKADVIQEAQVFAAQQGKVVVPISAKEKPMGSGPAQWASFEYQFRVVSEDDPAYKRAQMVHNPNIRIEKDDPDNPSKRSRTEIYQELESLSELKKKGIISEEEFQQEKRELLEET